MHFFYIFLAKNLHISKKSCNFAPELKNNQSNVFYILTIKYNSQITFIYKQQKVYNYGNNYSCDIFRKTNSCI